MPLLAGMVVAVREETLKDAVALLRNYRFTLDRRGNLGDAAESERAKLAIAVINEALGVRE